MAKGDLKKAIHRQYMDFDLLEVPAPEWPGKDGKPSVVRFRRRLSVDDAALFGSIGLTNNDSDLMGRLFAALAVDEDGEPLVDPNDREWFGRYSDAASVNAVMRRSGLMEHFMEVFAARAEELGDDAGN